MSAYLDLTADAAAYGIPTGATAAHVVMASGLIDEYLRRPEGLVWAPDYSGRPGWMVGMTPIATFNSTGGILAGANVVVPVTNMFKTTTLLGEVVVLDRTGASPEICTVTAVGTGSVTLDVVANAHSANTTLEIGLVIAEERQMPAKRSVTRVSRPNFARLVALQGRYGYGRRSDQMSGTYNEVNLLATLSTFGGPPQWVPIDISQVDTSPQTGEMWVPAGMMLAYYTDVRIRYIAGFPASGLPTAIKAACAQIVSTMVNDDLPSSYGTIKAGDTQISRIGSGWANGPAPRRVGSGVTVLSSDVLALLDPYRVSGFA